MRSSLTGKSGTVVKDSLWRKTKICNVKSPELVLTGLSNMNRILLGHCARAILVPTNMNLMIGYYKNNSQTNATKPMLFDNSSLLRDNTIKLNGRTFKFTKIISLKDYCTADCVQYGEYEARDLQNVFHSKYVTVMEPCRSSRARAVISQIGLFTAGMNFDLLNDMTFYNQWIAFIDNASKEDIVGRNGDIKEHFAKHLMLLQDTAEHLKRSKEQSKQLSSLDVITSVDELLDLGDVDDDIMISGSNENDSKESLMLSNISSNSELIARRNVKKLSKEQAKIEEIRKVRQKLASNQLKRSMDDISTNSPLNVKDRSFAPPSRSSPPHRRIKLQNSNNNKMMNDISDIYHNRFGSSNTNINNSNNNYNGNESYLAETVDIDGERERLSNQMSGMDKLMAEGKIKSENVEPIKRALDECNKEYAMVLQQHQMWSSLKGNNNSNNNNNYNKQVEGEREPENSM